MGFPVNLIYFVCFYIILNPIVLHVLIFIFITLFIMEGCFLKVMLVKLY